MTRLFSDDPLGVSWTPNLGNEEEAANGEFRAQPFPLESLEDLELLNSVREATM